MWNFFMLKINKLTAQIDTKEILRGVNLTIEMGRTLALMGKNGSGKSTLAQVLMGNPAYTVFGDVEFEGKTLLGSDPEYRSKAGIFLAFQHPSEILGVNVFSYLRMIYNATKPEKLSPIKFRPLLHEKMQLVDMDETFLTRYLNDGFSGGEKKRMEMLQMLVLEPKLAILDELDSGLDVDAIKIVAKAVNYLRNKTNMSVLIITHYARILKFIQPDSVSIMSNGRIIKTGDAKLAHEIEEKGYGKD